MEAEFWLERWRRGATGFHEAQAHRYLEAWWPGLQREGAAVFVPLCGKSLDLWWLRDRGHRVVGAELSPLAVEAFFSEAGVTPERRAQGSVARWEGGGVTLYCGDYFALRQEDLEGCSLVYDRAAFFAMPPSLRGSYAEQLRRLCPGGSGLLISLRYPQEERDGPPFSVQPSELRERFPGAELLTEEDVLAENPKLASAGLSSLYESAWKIVL